MLRITVHSKSLPDVETTVSFTTLSLAPNRMSFAQEGSTLSTSEMMSPGSIVPLMIAPEPSVTLVTWSAARMRMSLRPSWSHVLSRFNETIGWVGGGLAKRRRLPFARRTGLFQRPAVPLQTCRGSPPFLLLLTPAQYTGSYAPQIGGHIQNSVTFKLRKQSRILAEILPQSVGTTLWQ